MDSRALEYRGMLNWPMKKPKVKALILVHKRNTREGKGRSVGIWKHREMKVLNGIDSL